MPAKNNQSARPAKDDQRVQNVTECEGLAYAVGRGVRCDCHEFIVPDMIGCCCGLFTLRGGVLLFASADFIWFGALFLRQLLRIVLPEEYVGNASAILLNKNPVDWTDTDCFLFIGLPSLVVAIFSMIGVSGVFHRSILQTRLYAITLLCVLIFSLFMPAIFYHCPTLVVWWSCFYVANVLYNWWKFVITYNLVNAWLHARSGDERNKCTLQDSADFTHPCVNKYACIIFMVYLLFFLILMFCEFRNGRLHTGLIYE